MEHINSILQKVITDTEQIFASIAENYPRLLSELDAGIDEAAVVIQNITTLDIGDGTGSQRLSDFLELSRSRAADDLAELNRYQDTNRVLFNRLAGAIEGYRSSQRNIEQIRDISESLQIVSLNALCNAIKAGKGGEGFSVITGDLKNVTESTIEKTGILENKGAEVRKSLDRFNVVEDELDKQRKGMLSMLESKMLNGIKVFQSESGTIDKLFRGLNDESAGIRRSILGIMEELQQQDLIRQTLDQVILSTTELPEDCDIFASGPEAIGEDIDKAVFCARIINLATSMVTEVEGKISRAIDNFTGNFGISRKKLEYIQHEKEKAVGSFMANLESLKGLSKISLDVKTETNELSGKRRGLIELIQSIIINAESISEEFSSFEKISGWLQNVAVLSRIELSRSSSLSGMRESVEDMSGLVERIQMQITEGEKESVVFISSLNGIFEEYRTYAEEEMNFLDRFTATFSENVSRISGMNINISNILADFNFFTEDFHKLFIQSEKELDQLREIAQDLARVREELERVEDSLMPVLREKLHGSSIADWDIKDHNMNSIIEKFTIYSHKKTAGDVSGLNIEDAALDEGEITLF